MKTATFTCGLYMFLKHTKNNKEEISFFVTIQHGDMGGKKKKPHERLQINVSGHRITFLYTVYLRSSLSRLQDHTYTTTV